MRQHGGCLARAMAPAESALSRAVATAVATDVASGTLRAALRHSDAGGIVPATASVRWAAAACLASALLLPAFELPEALHILLGEQQVPVQHLRSTPPAPCAGLVFVGEHRAKTLGAQ